MIERDKLDIDFNEVEHLPPDEGRILVAQADTPTPPAQSLLAQPTTDGAGAGTAAGTTVIALEDGNIARLPADASIDAPRVNGTDLEFVQPDGSVIVIPNGAVQGLTLFIGTTEIPPTTVAALFEANDIQAAAGPAGAGAGGPGSSGGNFAGPVGNLPDALPFGGLLPPTALLFNSPEQQPEYEGLVIDEPLAGLNEIFLLDDDDLKGGNPFGVGDDDSTFPATGVLAHDYGNAPTGTVLLSGIDLPAGLNLSFALNVAGTELQVDQDGNPVFLITLVDTVSGAFTITQLGPLMHPEGDDENNALFGIRYRVTTVGGTAEGTLTINLDDDTPTAEDSLPGGYDGESTSAVQLDDEGATAKNPGLSGNEGGDGDVFGTANFTSGYLSFSPGADGLRDIDFASLDGTAAGFKAIYLVGPDQQTEQETVTYKWDALTHTLTAVGDTSGKAVFTLVIDNPSTGHFTLEFNSALVHPGSEGVDSDEYDDLSFDLPFTVTDNDGDTAIANLTISVDDDSPTIKLTAIDYQDGEQSTRVNPLQLQLDETFDGTPNDRGALGETTDGNGELDNVNTRFSAASLTTNVSEAAGKAFGQLSTAQGVDDEEEGTTDGALTGMFSKAVSLGADGGVVEELFALKLSGEGAEGEEPTGVRTTLVVTAVAGTPLAGLSDEARTVFLFQETDGSITGRIGGADGYIALRITLDGAPDPTTASLTIQQLIPLEHGDIELHDEQIALALVGSGEGDQPALTVSYTVTATDGDGDIVSQTASITLADESSTDRTAAFVFDDDGPTVTVEAVEGFALVHDESVLRQGDANDAGLLQSLTLAGAFQGVANPGHDPQTLGLPLGFAISSGAALTVSADFGSDGAAATGSQVFSLTLTDAEGGSTEGPLDSGLATTEGNPVYLFVEGDYIVGRYSANGGDVEGDDPAAFALLITGDGHVAMVQYVSLEHPLNPNADEPIDLSDMAGHLNATVTVTDGDGDTQSASVGIEAAIGFQDDGPTFLSARLDSRFGLLIDETAGNQSGTDDVTGTLSVFDGVTDKGVDPDATGPLGFATETRSPISFAAYYGVDGPDAQPVAYALSVTNEASGLQLTDGTAIKLALEGDLIVGRVVGTGAFGGDAAFAIAIDPATGSVSVVQYLSLQHAPGDADDLVSLAQNSVRATVTITDGDGDSVSRSFDISGRISFRDDGPTLRGEATVSGTVDEDDLHVSFNLSDGNADAGRPGEYAEPESNTFTSAAGALQSLVDFGVDGFGSFSVKTTAPTDSGVDSKGAPVLVAGSGTTLYGYVENGVDGSGYLAGTDRLVFTLTVNPDGRYTFTLNDQIDHPKLDDQTGDDSENLLDGKIDLSGFVQATDGDGDSVTLGAGSFTMDVRDDIPVLTARAGNDTTTTTTVVTTQVFDIHGGNNNVAGVNSGSSNGLWITATDLSSGPETANTNNQDIGVDDQQVDGFVPAKNAQQDETGPEILIIELVKDIVLGQGNKPESHGAAYEADGMRFRIDVAEAGSGDETGVVFVAVKDGGLPEGFTVTINGNPSTGTTVYENGTPIGVVFVDVPDDALFVVKGVTSFDTLEVGNYNGYHFDDGSVDGKTFDDGSSFKVYGLGVDTYTTTTTTVFETFKIAQDESADINTDADPNAADDVAGPVDPAVIGYAQSAISVLSSGSLFAGSVGADEDGKYAFAITDKNGVALNGVDSGLKTLSGAAILLSTNPTGELIGSAGLQDIFKVSVSADGFVQITQYKPIAHDIDGTGAASFDDIAKVTADLHITATLTDFDGDSVTATSPVALDIQFQDDGPVVVADVDNIAEDGAPATGNVLTGTYSSATLLTADDANATDGAADTAGTDGLGRIDWVGDSGSHVINGLYGQLSVDAAGNYSYALYTLEQNATGYYLVQGLSPGEHLTESFDYVLTDGDGDRAQTALTITIDGADDGVRITGIGNEAGDVVVDEKGLPARSGEPAGSAAVGDSEIATGSFTFEALDGLQSIKIADTTLTPSQLATATSLSPIVVSTGSVIGTLEIIGFTPTATGGTVSYRFTLTDNLLTHPDTDPGTAPVSDGDSDRGSADQVLGDSFPVIVTDTDGSSSTATIYVAVNDDGPVASPGSTSVNEGQTQTGTLPFVAGADGATVTSINGTALVFDVDGWSQEFVGSSGTLQVQADGHYAFVAHQDDPWMSNGTEQFTFTVTDADNDTYTALFRVSIADTIDTTYANLSVDDVTEDDASVSFKVTLTNPSQGNTTVVVLVNGVEHTVMIGDGDSEGSFTVATQDSDVYLDASSITGEIQSATGGNFEDLEIGTASATAQIADTIDTTYANLSVDDVTEDDASVSFKVTLTNPSQGNTTVVVLVNGVEHTVMIGDGDSEGSFTVATQDSDVYLDASSITGEIQSATGGNFEDLEIGTASATAQIADTIDTTYANLSVDDVTEDDASVSFKVTLTNPSQGNTTVVVLVNGVEHTVMIGDGDSEGSFTVATQDSDVYLDASSITGEIQSATGGNFEDLEIGTASATAQIADTIDTTYANLSVDDVTEDDASVSFKVTLTNPSQGNTTVVVLVNGVEHTVMIGDGDSEGSFTVATQDSDVYLDASSITGEIQSATGGNFEDLEIGTASATAQIADTIDTTYANLSVDDVTEDDASVSFKVTLTNPSQGNTTVVVLVNGVEHTVMIGDGDSEGSFTVATQDSDVYLDASSITGEIQSATGGNFEDLEIGTASATAQIADTIDTTYANLSVDDVTEDDASVSFKVTLTNPSQGNTTVVVLVNGVEHTVMIGDGDSEGSFTVATQDSDVYLDASSITGEIQSATGGNFEDLEIGTASATAQIADTIDTTYANLSVDDVTEDDASVSFKVTLTNPSQGNTTVVVLVNGVEHTVMIGDGDSEGSFTVATQDSDVYLDASSITGEIQSATGGNFEDLEIGTASATAQIADTIDTTYANLSVDDVTEDDASVSFKVTLTNPSQGNTTVVVLVNGVEHTVMIGDGDSEGSFTVATQDSDVYLDASSITGEIQSATGGNFEDLEIGTASATAQIADTIDTTYANLSVDDVTEDDASVSFKVTLTNPSQGNTTVVVLVNGVEHTVMIGDGDSEGSFTVATQDSDVYLDASSITGEIQSATGGNFEDLEIGTASATAQIADTIDTTYANLSVDDVTEDDASVSFKVTLTNPSQGNTTVVVLVNGVEHTVMIGDGDSEGSFTVATQDSDVYLDASSITGEIQSATGGNFEDLEIGTASATAQIADTIDTTTATLTAGTPTYDATGVIIPYTIALSSGLNPFAPTGGDPLTFTLADGTDIVFAVGDVSKTVNVHYGFGFTNPITNSITGVSGAEEYELLLPTGSTTINANTFPEVTDGVSSLTVYEAALDTNKDGSDLVAGAKTGTNPSSTGETAVDANTLVFHATGEAITSIKFVDPTTGGFSLANLAGGSATWVLSNGDRTLTLSINGQPALVLALTGATGAAAGADAVVSVTATLVSNFAHLAPTSILDVILSGIQVEAADASNDKVYGSISVNIVDDAPVLTGVMDAIIGNANNTVVTGLHGLHLGADGAGTIDIGALTTTSGVSYLPVVHLADGSARLTAQVAGADFFILTIKPDGTYDFNLVNARASVPDSFNFGSVSGGQSTIQFTLGDATFSAVDSNGNGSIGSSEELKPTSNGFGIANANLNLGEEFKVSFSSAIESVNFKVNNAGGSAFSMNWVTNTGETGSFSTSSTGLITVDPFQDFTWIKFSVTAGQAKLDTFGYSKLVVPNDLSLTFDISGVDSDGDASTHQTLGVTLLGQAASANIQGTLGDDAIGGTAGANTLSGLAGNDILTGGDGDDILIGGLGADTLTGGIGADQFVLDNFDLADVIADFAAGDKVDLTALFTDLSPANVTEYVHYDNTTGILQVDADGAGSGTFQTVATVNVTGVGHPSTITILFDDGTVTPHQTDI